MVSLQKVGADNASLGHFCGGTLVDGNSVLTAASCVDSFSEIAADPDNLEVLVSTFQLSAASANNRIPVSSVEIIPDWQPGGFAEGPDIAILQLQPSTQDQADLLNNLPKVSLVAPRSDIEVGVISIDVGAIRPGLVGSAIGWGGLSDPIPGPPAEIPVSDTLQEVRLIILNQNRCEEIGGEISSNVLCAGRQAQRGICYGDQGGPFLVRDQQVGVSSFISAPNGGCTEEEGFSGFSRLTQPEIAEFISSTSTANGNSAFFIPANLPESQLTFSTVTPELIVGSDPALNIEISSRLVGADLVNIVVQLSGGREILMEIDSATGTSVITGTRPLEDDIIISFNDKLDLLALLESQAVSDLTLSVVNDQLISETPTGDNLLRAIDLLFEAPIDFPVSSFQSQSSAENTGRFFADAPICDQIGQSVTTTITLQEQLPDQPITVTEVVACDGECVGRCGRGCDGISPGNVYTQGCFDHDVCCRELFRRGLSPVPIPMDLLRGGLEESIGLVLVCGLDCQDEYLQARNDFFSPARCQVCDAECSEQQVSGGTAGDLRTVRLLEMPVNFAPPQSQLTLSFSVSYNMFSIPDQLDVFFEGSQIATTGGLVSGTGTLSTDVVASPDFFGSIDPSVTIRVIGNSDPGTAWNYTSSCAVLNP